MRLNTIEARIRAAANIPDDHIVHIGLTTSDDKKGKGYYWMYASSGKGLVNDGEFIRRDGAWTEWNIRLGRWLDGRDDEVTPMCETWDTPKFA